METSLLAEQSAKLSFIRVIRVLPFDRSTPEHQGW
jgi:hypothetical protein